MLELGRRKRGEERLLGLTPCAWLLNAWLSVEEGESRDELVGELVDDPFVEAGLAESESEAVFEEFLPRTFLSPLSFCPAFLSLLRVNTPVLGRCSFICSLLLEGDVAPCCRAAAASSLS